LLALLCQPAELKPLVPVPDEISFWGIDSGIKHSVSGSDYTSVRVGAFMGQRIIVELMKQHASKNYPNIQSKYLADITPSLYEQYFLGNLPERMRGSKFIQQYQDTVDEVTEIEPEFIYSIRKPTAHPIYEHSRVQTFAELLKESVGEDACIQLGELMYQSHQSYSDCGLGSTGTDRLVAFAREFGSLKGLYGAKITGGGSGGTVALLGRSDARHLIEEIADKYSGEFDYEPYIFSGSSMGALAFGHITLADA
jgi:galactokinase